jgi:CBS domain-containing protein
MVPASLSDISVSDAMRHGVLTCQPETPLRTIARMMAEHRIHSVVVTNLDGVSETAWGIVTDVDLLRSTQADPEERRAGELAGSELLTVGPSESLERAAQLMAEHEATHVLVVDDGKPLGVLSSLDVAAVLAAPTG